MTSAPFFLCLMCLFLGKMAQTNDLKFSFSVHQERRLIAVNTGDSVTLRCFYEGDVAARFYWYKLNLGQKPKLISTFYKFDTNVTFHDGFKSDSRFTVGAEKGKISLKITNVHISDSATYYCASSYSFKFEFGEGTIIEVKGSGLNIQASVQQSASETMQPGGSVTLNCTVHTGTCDGEHSVHWFKDKGDSFPRIIYTHGGRNDQCERRTNTQTHTCVHNLPMKSLNVSHAGTYYCAVASCGHILFGNGTKLDFESEGDCCVSVYLLSGALAFTTFLSLLMAFLLYVTHKRNSSKFTESHSRCSLPSSTNAEVEQNEGNIHYAALRHHKADRSRRQRNNTKTECVYSSVKL
ncbi:immunoglobulin kappa light chain-like [Archocentrus centrarchus]|uniref:immunoglobulin kappa light chain-like n=1 Tax=Archocentrus centrarchus TaxID=63155 RepID=UPI0011E9C0CD|nr:immunoglobulin kappa light chain-like [Archocentrus centrarchus]